MPKKVLSWLFVMGLCMSLCAQELKVTEFRADITMTDAVKYPKTDFNGVRCGLVKVGLVIADAQFEGDIIAQEYKDGEWWIYLTKDANWITIKTKRYLPLRYEFEPIQSNVTYVMNIERPQVAYDGPTGTVKIECNLKNADVYIDGEKMSSVTPFEYKGSEGRHIVEVAASGYNRESATIEIKLNQKTSHYIMLQPEGSFIYHGISYAMVKVPRGTFMMGSPDKPESKNYPLNYAQPQHEVELRGFSIGKTEVTQALWKAVMGSNPSVHQGDNLPVENVTYEDCLEFIARLNDSTGKHFRLPTEAEWEFAASCRGSIKGNKLSGKAQTQAVTRVASTDANDLGIYDMSGNVAEWCADWVHTYSATREISPQGPDTGVHRVVRGGHAGGSDWAMFVSSRSHQAPDEASPFVGLRLAMDN